MIRSVRRTLPRNVLLACVAGCAVASEPGPTTPEGFPTAIQLEPVGATTANASLGDVDGDGDLDVVLARGRHWPLPNLVLWNDGVGGFEQGQVGGKDDRTYTTALADLDGDGDLDLVVGNDRPDDKTIFENDGLGQFTRTGTFGEPDWPTRNVTVADLTGDGRAEIIVANRGGPDNRSANYVCMNDGRGRFPEHRILSTESATTIAAGDLDADGDVDLVVPHRDGGQSYYHLNDGNGRFPDARPLGPSGSATRAIALGDVNGDGQLDVLVGDEEAKGVRIHLNEGGAFGPSFVVGAGTGVAYSIEVVDLDGDRDHDVVLGSRGSRGAILWNAGDGHTFELTRFGDDEGATYGLAIGDVDQDGDLDVVAARSGAPSMLYLADRFRVSKEAQSLAIVRRAKERLTEERHWNPRCDRTIRDADEPQGLYGALAQACIDVVGEPQHRHLALETVRRMIDRVAPGERFEHRLMDFNNSRSHGEVVALLSLAEAELVEIVYFHEHRGTQGPAFTKVRENAEIELVLRSLARRHPRWFRYETLGASAKGQPIPMLRVTDHEAVGDKRGVWIDAGIHGFEVTSTEVVAGFAESLGGRIDQGTAPGWLERVELILVPVINVDARELSMRPPYPAVRTNLRPVDDDDDGRVDEEPFVDLNGDGRIALLAVPDHDMTQESRDADGDGRYGEDPPGGVDLNRNFPVASRERPAGWKPEPETRAIVAFWERTPTIELAVSYHSSRNMFIEPNVPLTDDERVRYAALAEQFLAHFPGVAWRIHEEPEEFGVAWPLTGMSVEWFHSRGATAFILEIGPDEGPKARTSTSERIRLDPSTTATTWRVSDGTYYRTVESLLEAELAAQHRRHAAYLDELITRFDAGELDP